MGHDFDERYWDDHWGEAREGEVAPHPHLADELGGLAPGTALDAGCGEGGEATWLARHGWDVTAADISSRALELAEARAVARGVGGVRWVRADLTTWEPEGRFDLVTTHYAHPSTPQLEFYDRVAGWVAPGGTLLVVGHLTTHGHGHGHGHEQGNDHGQPPTGATVTAAAVAARLDPLAWEVVTAREVARSVARPGGRTVELQDVVVRAVRR